MPRLVAQNANSAQARKMALCARGVIASEAAAGNQKHMGLPRKTNPRIGLARPNRLRAMREAMGTTIEEMADRVGVARYTISRWETLAVNIPAKQLDAVARAYECAVSEIYERAEPAKPAEMAGRIIMAPVRLPSEAVMAEILEAMLDGNAMRLPVAELAQMLAERLPEEIERALAEQHFQATDSAPDREPLRSPQPRKH